MWVSDHDGSIRMVLLRLTIGASAAYPKHTFELLAELTKSNLLGCVIRDKKDKACRDKDRPSILADEIENLRQRFHSEWANVQIARLRRFCAVPSNVRLGIS